MRRELHSVREPICQHRRKDTGDAFLLLRVRTAMALAEWSSPLDADGQQAAASHADLPSRIKCLGWPSAGDKRNTAKVARTHPHRR
jgi:hypothetical protein